MPYQLLPGDVTQDGDVRLGRLEWGVLDHRFEVLAVPGVSKDRRERVAVPLDHLEDLRELTLHHEEALVKYAAIHHAHLAVFVGGLYLVPNFGYEALAAR